MGGWLLVPYRRRLLFSTIRELAIADVVLGTPDFPNPFTEVEGAGNSAVVFVERDSDFENASRVPGVLKLPSLALTDKLGTLTGADRRELVDAARSLGFNPAEVMEALGSDDGAEASFLAFLSFVTSRRTTPRYDAERDEIVFDGPIRGPARPLPGVFAGGAFPTTGLLDDFNRENQVPPSADWTNGVDTEFGNDLLVNSNMLVPDTNFCSSWWNDETFGPDVEAHLTIVVKPGNGLSCGLYARLTNPGTASVSGYATLAFISGGTDTLEAYRLDNDSYTVLGAALSEERSDGEILGLEIIGSGIKAYVNGGSWVEKLSRSDNTYSGAGFIGVQASNFSTKTDDFGGGTIASASTQDAEADLVPSSAEVYDPSAVPGPVAATADDVPSSAVVYDPTALAVSSAEADDVPSSAVVYDPSAEALAPVARPLLVTSSAEVYDPSAVPGPVSAVAEFVLSGVEVFEPGTSFIQSAETDVVVSSAEVYDPSASTAFDQSATPEFVSTSSNVFLPYSGDPILNVPLPPAWTFEVISRAGVPAAVLVPETFVLTRRLKRSSFADFTVRSESIGADEIGHDRIIRAWRNRDPGNLAADIRFAGQVGVIVDTGDTDGNETATVRVDDPFAPLAERLVQAEDVYTAEDQGAIIEALIVDQNTREPTHLRMGSYETSVDRDRTYELGKVVGEAIEQLSDVIDGPYFVIDAVDDEEVVGELTLRPDGSGTDRTETVRFEYGAGTIRNVARVTVDAQPPVNAVLAVGATGEDGLTLMSSDSAASSIGTYGMREKFASQTDVSVQATLDEVAETSLYAEPLRTYQLETAAPSADGFDNVPRLFDDFDVGDLVTLYANGQSPRLQFEVAVRVIEVKLTVDTEGVETLTSVTVEVV